MESPYWQLNANQEITFTDEYGTVHTPGDRAYVPPDERTVEVLYRKGRVYTGIRRNTAMTENQQASGGGAGVEAIRSALSREWDGMHDEMGRPTVSYDESDASAAYRAGYRHAMDIVEGLAAGEGGNISAQQIATYGGVSAVGEPTTEQTQSSVPQEGQEEPQEDARDFAEPQEEPQAAEPQEEPQEAEESGKPPERVDQ